MRPLDLGHDLVAGIDAESALDALKLRAVADVDSGGADSHALIAIDAVATSFPGLSHLVRPARLPAPAAISNQQRVAVEHRTLDARPGTHIDAHLLARDSAEHVGGGGENADAQIGGEGRIERYELPSERRRVGEIEHPGAAGGDRDQEPSEMRGALARQGLGRPRRLVEPEPLVAVALPEALDRDHQIGPHRLRTGVA